MKFTFSGEVWYWRGPSPFHFVTVPLAQSQEIKQISNLLTYGWGVIPVSVSLGTSHWTTSLIPKSGVYLVPLKTAIRDEQRIGIGDLIEVELLLGGG